ncbi:head-tail connector protein [Microvirga sp. TS319]|uniref:head-tail connector protein n=1 Tax=Microvirga sp. TS319 TaxID=3241165 RepID=UPI00351A3B38
MLIPLTEATPVVTLDEAKGHLRVDHTDDDAYIRALIGVASVAVADRTDRTIGVREWEWRVSYEDMLRRMSPCQRLRIPAPPLLEVLSIKYRDGRGTEQTYPADDYEVIGANAPQGGYIRLKNGRSWPSVEAGTEAAVIRFRAGYEEVPEPIKQAVLLMIGHLYSSRGEMIRQEFIDDPTIKALLAPYKVWGV